MATSVDKCDQLSILKQHPTHRESEYRLVLGVSLAEGLPGCVGRGAMLLRQFLGRIHNAVRDLLSTRYRAWHVP